MRSLIPLAMEYSWLPLIASVLVALMRPAATLVIWRSAPTLPTDTVFSRLAMEPAPKATLLAAEA